MKPYTLQQIATMAGGALIQGDPQTIVRAVSTDTRAIPAGSLFVALAGEKFDAHDFVDSAFSAGAAAALVSHRVETAANHALILVPDTLAALQQLAAACRAELDLQVVCVTGSNGKTSTKDFLNAVLSQKFRVTSTRGNLNNHIGLPLSVLAADETHTAAVWELGMNHFGEIAPLAAIAHPRLAVITNIGTAHIEFMGSREGIALEKGRLVEAIGQDGVVILNADDDQTPGLAARTRGRVITAGLTAGDVRAENIDGSTFDLVTASGRTRITLPVPGRHMIQNALLAAAAGLALEIDLPAIKAGLEGSRLAGGRLERQSAGGLSFINDAYNANPDSMKAALETLASLPCSGRRIAVLGRMGELGEHAAAGHKAVGEAARAVNLDLLVTAGSDEARQILHGFNHPESAHHFATHREAAQFLKTIATPADLILVKGSRSAAMENVIKETAAI